MRVYKSISFSEGIKCSLAEFKKDFAPLLKGLSSSEVKQAHKSATKGNGKANTDSEQRKKSDT